MKFITRIQNLACYKLTEDEILLYKYMEILSYIKGVQVETYLVDDVLSIKGSNVIEKCIVTYFEELSKSSKYKIWLRKHKLNNICLKLVK